MAANNRESESNPEAFVFICGRSVWCRYVPQTRRVNLRHKEEFVAVEEGAAEGGEAVGLNERNGVGEFGGGGGAAEGELVGEGDLFGGVGAGFLLHAGGEGFGLFEGEEAVEEVECLDGGGAFDAAGGALAGVGAVEGAEDGLGFAAHFVGVDHAALVFGGECFDGIETAEAAALIEEIEAAAVHLRIQTAADGEHGVADGFGFETAGGEAPEVADVGVEKGAFIYDF